MTTPLLSVIVPVHNTEKYLSRCLDSILDQGLAADDYEILVVDDGSTDGSAEILEQYERKYDHLTVLQQANRGVAVARNRAIARARGRYLQFVDSDDYLAPQVVGPLVATASQHRLDVLAFDLRRVPHHHLPVPPRVTVPDDAPLVMTGVEYVAAHRYLSESVCYLIDRDLAARLGALYDPGRIAEDILFTATVVCAAERLAHVPVVAYHYVQRPGSIMATCDDAHTRKLVVDYERVVCRLDELRLLWRARGASDAFDHRLRVREQTFVFFLVARLVRSSLPVRATLAPVLDRLEALGAYPMKDFPSDEFPGLRYRTLTAVFNRPYLIWPFAAMLAQASRARRALPR